MKVFEDGESLEYKQSNSGSTVDLLDVWTSFVEVTGPALLLPYSVQKIDETEAMWEDLREVPTGKYNVFNGLSFCNTHTVDVVLSVRGFDPDISPSADGLVYFIKDYTLEPDETYNWDGVKAFTVGQKLQYKQTNVTPTNNVLDVWGSYVENV